MSKVLVGISGGVDSATSCALLIEKGYSVAGINFNFIDKEDKENIDAINVCKKLGIEYFHVNKYDEFKEKIIGNFIYSYNNGLTPNPCILCNKFFKFGAMLDFAIDNGFDYISTGHYAKVEYSEKYKRNVIKKASNLKKDQSYFLYSIPKKALDYLIFPLEDIDSKDEVRHIAEESNLAVAKKKDSLDVCFIPDKDYKKYLLDNHYAKEKKGNVTLHGKTIGTHDGLFKYTIGQRKGLGISYSEPIYVIGFNHEKNELIVGLESDLYSKEVEIYDANLLLFDELTDGMKLNARIRYQGKDEPCEVYNIENGYRVVFDNPVKSPTPGQALVFYIDDILVGGGTIK